MTIEYITEYHIISICNDCNNYLSDNLDVIWHHHGDDYGKVIDRIEEGIASKPYDRFIQDGTLLNEFSVTPCECCGSKLAGVRFKATLRVDEIAPAYAKAF